MPVHLESMLSMGSVTGSTALNEVLSNPLYTAISVAFIFVLLVALFFPLKKDKASKYFKLLIYCGIASSIIISVHNELVIKAIEARFSSESPMTDLGAPAVPIEPRKGGALPVDKKVSTNEDEVLNTIIRDLEDESK